MLLIIFHYDSVYNHIKAASELKPGCDYCLFKKGIRPMWEDAANKLGGRWLISLEKKHRTSELDNFWLEIVSILVSSVGFPLLYREEIYLNL